MPELPEVEIVRQSLNKKINQKKVKKVIIRNRNLRFLICEPPADPLALHLMEICYCTQGDESHSCPFLFNHPHS